MSRHGSTSLRLHVQCTRITKQNNKMWDLLALIIPVYLYNGLAVARSRAIILYQLLYISFNKHIKAWTKWPLLCRQHFEIHIRGRKCLHFYLNFIGVRSFAVCSWESSSQHISFGSGNAEQATSQYLIQCRLKSKTSYGVTRPPWVYLTMCAGDFNKSCLQIY